MAAAVAMGIGGTAPRWKMTAAAQWMVGQRRNRDVQRCDRDGQRQQRWATVACMGGGTAERRHHTPCLLLGLSASGSGDEVFTSYERVSKYVSK